MGNNGAACGRIEEKMPTFYVTDFGATANDNTDDSAAIQAAIDAAYLAGGGTVVIPEGTFYISGDPANPSEGCIEVRSNVTLTGAGMGETVLKLVDNFDARINGIVRTPVNESVDNVVMKDFTIDGNRANNIEHQAGIITGVKTNEDGITHQNITISGVEVMNCNAYGINPHEITYNLVVEDCVSHDNGKDGFVADYVDGGIYRNNIAYNNDRHGFNVTTSSRDVVLENNKAYDNAGAGLVTQRADIFPEGQNDIDWPTRITIIGGEYYSNDREGLLIKLSDNVTVTGALIYGNDRQGIRIEGATNVTINGNTIYNNSQAGDGVYDEINIRLRIDDTVDPPRIYYSEGTEIFGNTIYSDGAIRGRYGIREELTNSTADNPSGTIVYGNTVTGERSGDIFIPPHSATEGADIFYGTASGDAFAGLGGDDVYIVNHSGDTVTEQANGGNDTVIASLNHTLAANVEDLLLIGNAIRGTGNGLDNEIVGNAVANELEGLGGADILDGGLGADIMQGGDGNDTYFVDNVGDTIVEKDNLGAGGYDTVYSSVSYTLATQVEKLVLLGSDDLNATGNSAANVLIGNDGDNRLDGMAGADQLIGGKGDDTYVVDHTSDVVTELANEGIDTVVSSLTYVLGANLENLTLSGTLNRDATGNELANVLKGNDGANKIHGMEGNDTIEGGLGLDQLYGDGGNDTFVLRKGELAGDVIEDFTGNGAAAGDQILFTGFSSAAVLVDLGGGNWMVQDGSYTETFRIKTPVGQTAFVSADYSFEGVVVTPINTAPVTAAIGNETTGNEDTLITGAVPAASDAEGNPITYQLVGSLSGLTFNADGSFSYQPPANANGNVTFDYIAVDSQGAASASRSFTIAVTAVNDAPETAVSGNGAAGLEDMLLTGSVPAASDIDSASISYIQIGSLAGLTFAADGSFTFSPPANAFGDFTFEYAAVDAEGLQSTTRTFTLTVASVNDAPTAATTGNSTSGQANTTITGTLPTGTDIDGDTISYALVTPLSGLVLNADGSYVYTPASGATGTVSFDYKVVDSQGAESAAQSFSIAVLPPPNLTVTGTNGNNTLYGGAGDDTINGLGGSDRMYGYAGNDTYYVNTSSDRVYEAVGGGNDRVLTTSSFTIQSGQEIEVVQAMGSSSVSLTGNAFANTLIGNAANNTLSGNGGNDRLDGGLGRDSLTGGSGRDSFVFSTALSSTNIDTVRDFRVVDDTIVLDKAIFSALAAGQLSADSFVIGTQAADASDRIIYNSTAGTLLYDADGAGGQAAVQFATISKNLAMTYLDFVVEDNAIT
jgi:parallel beta-helix repeat protein